MKLSAVAAIGRNRGLGFGNKLSWDLPDDMKRFRDITRGHTVIMGRKTYESMGRTLPERQNIIVTRNQDFKVPGGVVVDSIEEAIKIAGGTAGSATGNAGEIFVIGGGEIYKLALPYLDKMYLTLVDAELPADAYFPEFDEGEWQVTETVPHEVDDKHPYKFIFKTYERKKK